MHDVNMLRMLIPIHYLHYRFSFSCKSNAHTIYSCFMQYRETYSDKYYFNLLIHAFFSITGIAPATAVNTETPATLATVVNTYSNCYNSNNCR